MEFDIENGEIFSEGYQIPQIKTLNESSEINNYNKFFANFYNK